MFHPIKTIILSTLLLSGCSANALKTSDTAATESAPAPFKAGNAYSAYVQGAVADVRGDEARAAAAYSYTTQAKGALFTATLMRALEKHLLQGDVPTALEVAKASESNGGDALMQWVVLLADAAQRNDTPQMRQYLKSAQTHLPELIQFHLMDAYMQLRSGVSRKKALKALEDADIVPGYLARLNYHKARMALIEDDAKSAQNTLEDAHELEKGALFTSRLLARVYYNNDDAATASEVLNSFRAKHAGALLLADVTDADFLTQDAARPLGGLKEDVAETFFGLSVLLWAQGAETPARQFMALALSLNPADPFMPYYAGVLAESAGQTALARQYYTQMANTDGLKLAAASRLAAVANAEDDTLAAIMALKTGLVLAPSNMVLMAQLAATYETDNNFTAAIKLYSQMLPEISKNDTARRAQLLFARGAAYERQQKFDAATTDLKAALKLTPDEPMILNYLGYMWVDADMHVEEGLKMLKRAHQLAPESAAVLDSLGWAYYKVGKYSQALLFVSRAVDKEPEDATLQDHLGDVYAKIGNAVNARKHWQLALELATRPNAQVDVNLPALRKKLK